MRRAAWVAPLAVVALLLATPLAAAASSPSARLAVGTDGSVGVAIAVVDANGSALRYAMDGNFTPLVNLIPGNASTRSSILARIQSAESSPFLAGLFGNHDGSVESSEVGLFESLLRDEVGALPSDALTGAGILNLTLNGQAPGSAAFEGVTFGGAVGLDSSTAPITITSSTTDSFPPEGTSGTLGIAWNLTLGSGLLAAAIPNVSLSVSMPAGTTITSTSGILGVSVSNDPFGYGAPSASGLIGTTLTGTASVAFHPAFPLGDVLIGVALAAAVGAAAFVVWRRRKRRADEADDAPRG
jgi:membrane protein implicated in regulation of membrane protease activity